MSFVGYPRPSWLWNKIRFYLVATVLDMSGHYLLFYREFVASVRTEGQKHRYTILST